MTWLKKYKGYLVTGAGWLIVFLNPSAQAWLMQPSHAKYAVTAAAAWAALLHWAEGKGGQKFTPQA